MTPGRKFSTTTSAVRTSRLNTSLPASLFRFSVRERLPGFWARKDTPMWARLRSASAPSWRARSPPSRASTLITSAPMCASWWQAKGPASTLVRSRTRTPCRGWTAMISPVLGLRGSVDLDLGFADDVRPALLLALEQLRRLLRRAGPGQAAFRQQPGDRLRLAQRLLHLGVQPVHDIGRCAGRGHQHLPVVGLETLVAGFGDGGRVGKNGQALRGAHRECAQLAGLHEAHDRLRGGEVIVDLAAEQV